MSTSFDPLAESWLLDHVVAPETLGLAGLTLRRSASAEMGLVVAGLIAHLTLNGPAAGEGGVLIGVSSDRVGRTAFARALATDVARSFNDVVIVACSAEELNIVRLAALTKALLARATRCVLIIEDIDLFALRADSHELARLRGGGEQSSDADIEARDRLRNAFGDGLDRLLGGRKIAVIATGRTTYSDLDDYDQRLTRAGRLSAWLDVDSLNDAVSEHHLAPFLSRYGQRSVLGEVDWSQATAAISGRPICDSFRAIDAALLYLGLRNLRAGRLITTADLIDVFTAGYDGEIGAPTPPLRKQAVAGATALHWAAAAVIAERSGLRYTDLSTDNEDPSSPDRLRNAAWLRLLVDTALATFVVETLFGADPLADESTLNRALRGEVEIDFAGHTSHRLHDIVAYVGGAFVQNTRARLTDFEDQSPLAARQGVSVARALFAEREAVVRARLLVERPLVEQLASWRLNHPLMTMDSAAISALCADLQLAMAT